MSMYLDEIRNVILLFSNPSWKGVGTVSSTVIRNVTHLTNDVAYSARFSGNTTVLSSRYAAEGTIGGLLYVPDLPGDHACTIETSHHIPGTVARQDDLPPTYFHLIALAPWVNGRCAEAYLDAARMAPVRAFLFYLPGTWAVAPPPAHAEEWHIHGSHSWMSETAYPVFAVSGAVGEIMMQHSSLYSGNLSEIPFSEDIARLIPSDPEDYIRIWTELSIGKTPTGLATWIYVLIILGLLFFVVTATSLLMHIVQACRRASLRRRVIAGDVNLEAMGIRHLTVPVSHIQTFPLFTYCNEPNAVDPPLPTQPTRSYQKEGRKHGFPRRPTRTSTSHTPEPSSSQSSPTTDVQSTCEICLSSFVNRETIIRELSCGHIFHPECIDPFLAESSSLCPVCKASMLPPGYCPKITNDMVRRERAVRRLRGQVDDDDDDDDDDGDDNDDDDDDDDANEDEGAGGDEESGRREERGGSSSSNRWKKARNRGRWLGGWGRHGEAELPTSETRRGGRQDGQGAGQIQRSATPNAQSRRGGNRRRGGYRNPRPASGVLEPEPDPPDERNRSRWHRIRVKVFPGF